MGRVRSHLWGPRVSGDGYWWYRGRYLSILLTLLEGALLPNLQNLLLFSWSAVSSHPPLAAITWEISKGTGGQSVFLEGKQETDHGCGPACCRGCSGSVSVSIPSKWACAEPVALVPWLCFCTCVRWARWLAFCSSREQSDAFCMANGKKKWFKFN